jgi:hypothetical protein
VAATDGRVAVAGNDRPEENGVNRTVTTFGDRTSPFLADERTPFRRPNEHHIEHRTNVISSLRSPLQITWALTPEQEEKEL